MFTLDFNQIEKICQIYGRIKHYMLMIEEFDLGKTYIQPRLELYQAFDHVISEYFLEQLDNKEGSLAGAMKHMYTAFFDIADWTSIQIRSRVFEELNNFSPDIIKTAIPDYYNKIRPALDELNEKIAQIRSTKTFEKFEHVDEYVLLLDEAYDYIKKIRQSKGSLIELKKKYKIKTLIGPAIGILAIIVSILIAVFF